ncbi:MAG: radical SAM protein [Candidatus Lokiarchaeota archaeon]|nr:radical SAM protein [Candidatus Lokiarchaeota archaeon]MBD3338822.1 radical SAM protein [Candidatus Lokiarchaeota archaeon]
MFLKKQNRRKNPPIDLFLRKDLIKLMNKGKIVCVSVEINERCAGGCLYCYASSLDSKTLPDDNISIEKFKEILKLRDMGVRVVYFYGGDQLIHPHFKDMLFYALNEGLHVYLPLAGMIPSSKLDWLIEAQTLALSKDLGFFIGIHIDTLNKEIYNQVNCIPESLQAKIDGYNNLLKAGFIANHIYGCPTLTSQTARTITNLIDWFYSKGAGHVAINTFRPLGLSKDEGVKWEPSLSQIEKAFKHMAAVEGKQMLMVGNSDGKYACQSHVAVTAKGDIVPCLLLRQLPEGNIHKEKPIDIVKRAKKKLQLKIKIKGPCASCVSKLVCYGCRANAYIYCGDINASDPKCFYNPEAPDKCFKV